KYIEEIRKKYPGLARALFDDREDFMARNLLSLNQEKKILAFVGDGHLKGLKKRIPEARAVCLRDMIKSSISFSYTIST
ncbi:MAG: conjugal transfer protein TraB, partial [Thermoplasmata archaeon]|nr:conjugal transfer protein TraB [Thermoplasmata archaeon]